jgi:tripartite-type tricarboxylate transporter receptor subunit TctC
LPRRRFLHFAAAAIAATPWPVCALDYPTRPVRVIVGFPAGGQQDIMARLIAQWLSERLGQQVLVENRSGAGGNIGAEAVANAAPDGHTLLLVGSPNAINATLYDKPGFVFQRDIVPVAGIARTPLIAEVHPSVPVRTLPEFIAYAKANPGRLSYASAGNGTSQHFAVELLKLMTGVDMLHVPYRGVAPALVDLLAGHVQFMIDPLPASLPHVRTGALRPLAVTTMARYSALPDLPTVHEFIPGYEADSWYGIGAPRGTPRDVIATLNREINAGLANAAVGARIAELGAVVAAGSPTDFGTMIAEEIAKWGKVVKVTGAKAE